MASQNPNTIIHKELRAKGLRPGRLCVFQKMYNERDDRQLYVIGLLYKDQFTGNYCLKNQYIINSYKSNTTFVQFLIKGLTYSSLEFVRKPSEFEENLYYLGLL